MLCTSCGRHVITEASGALTALTGRSGLFKAHGNPPQVSSIGVGPVVNRTALTKAMSPFFRPYFPTLRGPPNQR